MLELLIRHDRPLPAPAVRLFVNNMINDSLIVRKVNIIIIPLTWKLWKSQGENFWWYKVREIHEKLSVSGKNEIVSQIF